MTLCVRWHYATCHYTCPPLEASLACATIPKKTCFACLSHVLVSAVVGQVRRPCLLTPLYADQGRYTDRLTHDC